MNYFTGNVIRPKIRFGLDPDNRLQLAALEKAFRNRDGETVRRTWKTWLDAAKAGDQKARERIYAFWVNRMSGELVNTKPEMVRFDNGNIVEGAVDPGDLKERAIFGLYSYYVTNRGLQKELTADVAHLFDPLMAIVEDTALDGRQWEHNPRIWGEALLSTLYKNLRPQQQEIFLRSQKDRLLTEGSEEQRQKIISRLGSLHAKNPNLSFWQQELVPELGKWVEKIGSKQDPGEREEAKYPLLLLSLIGQIPGTLREFAGTGETPDLQVAAAWIAGHQPTDENLALLETILENDAYDERCREMALISLGEYAKSDRYKDRANRLIASFLPEDGAPETPLEETAAAINGKVRDLSNLETPEYYIQQWLKNEEERDGYRELRNDYLLSGFDELDTAARNMIDRVLIPYRRYLPDLLRAGRRHIITSPSASAITDQPECREYLGVRTEDGSLYDSLRGVALTNGYAVTGHANIAPDGNNDFAHEFFHHLQDDVLKARAEKDYSGETAWSGEIETVQGRIEGLYKAAVSESRALDYYAATEDSEYLAQGNAAWDVRTMSHAELMNYAFSDGYHDHLCNIRSKLMRRDPALYDFLKTLPDKPLWKKPSSVRIRIG